MSASSGSSTTIQSVSRASRILVAVAGVSGGLTAQQVSDRLGLGLSTAYHLLSTLADEGMLAKVEGRRYTLGRVLGEIAATIVRELRPPARYLRALDQVAESTGETAYLTGWHVGTITILATVEGAHAVRVAGLETGFTESVHARASGKLLLAFAEPAARDALMGTHELTRYTPATITDAARFDDELSHIRAAGEAHDREEYREGVRTLARPILEHGTVTAALAVSAPAARFEAHEEAIRSALADACARAQNG